MLDDPSLAFQDLDQRNSLLRIDDFPVRASQEHIDIAFNQFSGQSSAQSQKLALQPTFETIDEQKSKELNAEELLAMRKSQTHGQ